MPGDSTKHASRYPIPNTCYVRACRLNGFVVIIAATSGLLGFGQLRSISAREQCVRLASKTNACGSAEQGSSKGGRSLHGRVVCQGEGALDSILHQILARLLSAQRTWLIRSNTMPCHVIFETTAISATSFPPLVGRSLP